MNRIHICLCAAISAIGLWAQTADSVKGDKVQFQIITDKLVYRPQSKMLVKFLISNVGADSIYIHSAMTTCASLYGQFDLQILDNKGLDVKRWKCWADDFSPGIQTIDPVVELQNHWIKLSPDHILGWQRKIEVPSAKGVYRLKADLIPPGNFGAQQKEILQQKGMRILNSRHQAQIVSITVK